MKKILNVVQDEHGEFSSMRVGKLCILGVWMFQAIMNTINSAVYAEPTYQMTFAVLASFGIAAGQKIVEGKRTKN